MLLLCVLLALPVSAQSAPIEPLDVPHDPNASVQFPPPVYTVSGEVPIVGTVNVANMANYFVQFRPLELGAAAESTNDTRPWFPATLPATSPIVNNVIGTWNTMITPDGLYELRLVVNVGGRNPIYARVAPLRVLNNPSALSPFAVVSGSGGAAARPTLMPTPTQLGIVQSSAAQATQNALATQFAGGGSFSTRPTASAPSSTTLSGPRVTAITDANVRRGDDTRYERVGALLTGETVSVIGISSTGSGWYYIQLADGRRGYIAPSTVRFEGDRSTLQVFTPPPPPATATPVPTATPAANSNLVVNGLNSDPRPAVCNQDFTVLVNVTNTGPSRTPQSALLLVQDRHVGSNQITTSGTATVPQIDPGQSWVATVVLRVSTYYLEEHDIIATVNYNNAFSETNTNDNRMSFRYTLAQGGC